MKHLTRALALGMGALRHSGQRHRPGLLRTDMNRGFLNTDAGQAMLKRIPQRRAGSPEEFDGVLLLRQRRFSYMTGATLVVDGGHLYSTL
jgi:NAD(P)-dependent dehydrogenase (short-subunit alcohol dehydrogenase family)